LENSRVLFWPKQLSNNNLKMSILSWTLLLVIAQFTYASSTPVDVTLYAESLCPYCAAFIQDNHGLILNDLAKVVSFRYVAYGNAKLDKYGTLQCQHGPKECELNRVINCVQDIYPDQNQWLPFVVCIESDPDQEQQQGDQPDEMVITCSKTTALDPSPILSCAAGTKGDELEKKAAEEREAYRVKLRRAYDVGMEMQKKGLLPLTKAALDKQVDDIMEFDDNAFEAFKRSVANAKTVRNMKVASDLGGVNVGVETDTQTQPTRLTADKLMGLWS
jgi:interferon gamma-inducible protein 30